MVYHIKTLEHLQTQEYFNVGANVNKKNLKNSKFHYFETFNAFFNIFIYCLTLLYFLCFLCFNLLLFFLSNPKMLLTLRH